MKKSILILISLLLLAGCQVPAPQATPAPEVGKSEPVVASKAQAFFMREADDFILYKMDDGQKWETGLKVAVIENEDSPVNDIEEIFGVISPDGKKIAYMQKPAWPHKIFIANIDGTGVKELVTPELPAHEFFESTFSWSSDGKFLLYSQLNVDGYPGGGSSEAKLYQINIESGEKTMLLSDAVEYTDETGEQYAKIMPVHK